MADNKNSDHGVKTKDQIIKEIKDIIANIKSGEGDEANKSVKSHIAYVEFAERFLERVKHTKLPEIKEDGWEFFAEITENSANLYLEYIEYDEKAKKRNDGYICTILETFDLVEMKPKMLTVEDYAQLHEVNVGTVRQWIRRGKIRKAQKIGKEWRIPEFVEPATGRYSDGIFTWTGEKLLDLPVGYEYLNDYDELAITQIDSDTYKVGLMAHGKKEFKRKLITISSKEREKLELYLISNPFVVCFDARMNFALFEDNIKKEKEDMKKGEKTENE